MFRVTVWCVAMVLPLMAEEIPEVIRNGLTSCQRHDDCPAQQFCFFSYDKDSNARKHGFCFAELDDGLHSKSSSLTETEMAMAVDEDPPAGIMRGSGLSMSMLETGAQMKVDKGGTDEPADDIIKFNPEGLKVSSLTVQAPQGKSAVVVLGSGADHAYHIGVNAHGMFSITQGDKDVVTVTSEGDVVARTKVLAAAQLQADGGFIVNDVQQWSLAVSEDFSIATGADGWKTNDDATNGAVSTSKCKNGLFMLGGYKSLSDFSTRKTFNDLPKHNRVRVHALYHFIDLWNGETGYMSLSTGDKGAMEYGWTETYDVADYSGLIDVCGGDTGEGKFTSTIDLAVPHQADSLTIEFGSTLSENASGSKAFFGVSSVEIYLRLCDDCVFTKF